MVATILGKRLADKTEYTPMPHDAEKGRYIKSFEKAAASGRGCFGGSAFYWKLLNKKNVPKGSTFYDLCCGQGQQFLYLSELVGENGLIIGADMVPSFVEEAKRNIQDFGLDNVEVYLRDCCNLKPLFTYDGADIVTLFETIGYVSMEDNHSLLDEASRACRKGGTLFATAEAKEFYSSDLMSKGYIQEALLLLEKGIIKNSEGLWQARFSKDDLKNELVERGFEPQVTAESVREAFGKRFKIPSDLMDLEVKNIVVARKVI